MEGWIMTVVLIEGGKVDQVWRDVGTLDEFEEKYGLSGPEYIEGGHPSGTLFDGTTFTAPPKPDVTAEQIQAEANALLEQTDWVHLPDANITTAEKNAIIGFRQAVQAISHSPRPRDLGLPPLENAFKRNGR